MEYRRPIYAPVEVLSLLSDPLIGLCLVLLFLSWCYNRWTVPSGVNYEGGGRRFDVRVLYLYVRFSAEEAMSMQEVPDWSFLTWKIRLVMHTKSQITTLLLHGFFFNHIGIRFSLLVH